MNGTLDQTNATEPLTEGISNLHPPIRTGGIFPTQDPSTLINTTATAAKVVWHVMQEFIAEFVPSLPSLLFPFSISTLQQVGAKTWRIVSPSTRQTTKE